MSSFGRRSHLRSALTLGILVTAANCTICNCEEPPRDPDCVRARADVMGDHWPEGVMLTLFVDDVLVASADCSDLPGDGDTRECSVDTEFEILLNEVVLSSASAGASIEINVDGLDGRACPAIC